MNRYLSSYSESVVFSLCEEIEYIKNRTRNINYSLKTCKNKALYSRLKFELNKLNKNRINIATISETLFKSNCNELSIQFLFEVIKRSNSLQEI